MTRLRGKPVGATCEHDSLFGRFVFVALAAAFIAVLRLMYIQDLSPVYSYVGLNYNEPSLFGSTIIWTLALIPATFLSLRLKRPSHFFLFMLYICVYIPSLLVSLYLRLRPETDVIMLAVTLLVGLLFMAMMLRGEAKPYTFLAKGGWKFWGTLWGLFVISSVWIIAVFGSSLQLVSLGDVYGLRLGSRTIFDQSNVGFAVMMMMGAVNPLLMALGLQRGSKFLTLAGIGGQLLCYSTGGFKIIAFSLGMILVLHFGLRKHMRHAAHALMILASISLFASHLIVRQSDEGGPATLVVDAVVMRTFVIPGELTAQYHDFFENHPHLHLSNTKPFSWVLSNPLNDDVIFAITKYYGGDSETTSNANFWAQDGTANFGLFGIVAVSILAGGVLRIVDRVSVGHDPCFSTMAFSFTAFNLCNAPLSTTLLSGGLALAIALMFLGEPQLEPKAQASARKGFRELVMKYVFGVSAQNVGANSGYSSTA